MRAKRERENPKIRKNKVYFRIFGAAFNVILLAVFMSGCTKEVLKDEIVADTPQTSINASIAETFPANQADTVVVNPVVTVTFNSSVSASEVANSTLILKEGATPVAGTLSNTVNTITFTPSADLKPDTKYTATVKSVLKSGSSADSREHSWSFTTGKNRQGNTLSIVSVTPLRNATNIAVDVKPTITFNRDMTNSTANGVKITLLQGTTPVAGTLTYSGKTATFSPTNNLAANAVYTGRVVFGSSSSDDDDVDDDDDDHKSASAFTWNFTTSGGGADVTAPTVLSAVPVNSATGVANSIHPSVTFSEAMNAATINTTNFTLKQGATAVAGTVAYSGNTATFTPSAPLAANTVYTGTIATGAKDAAGNALANNYTWSFTTAAGTVVDVTAPTVLSAVPANNATGVANSIHPSVTFSEAMDAATINTTNFTLKQGSTSVAGTVAYSGNTATFTPSAPLAANTVYTGTIATGAKDAAGNSIAGNYTWSFTTAAAADVTAPTVLSAVPANNATGIASSIRPSVTFSEAMNAATINTTNFTLKQGATSVAGTVAYSGTTATFTPSAPLAANTVYTGTIAIGAKDAAGNSLAGNYTWSFTTTAAADVTAPTVLTIVPASGAISIAVNSNVTATFSEAMNASTINATTFTLKQGSTTIAGSVSYSGNTATFNPTNDLAGNTVYTASITTGAMDVAGNALATTRTWSFTTIATVQVVSWATQVWPIIQSKCTPCHGSSGGAAGVNMGSYAQVSSMSNSAIDNSGMYSKLGVTAAEQTIIKAWIAAGKPNN